MKLALRIGKLSFCAAIAACSSGPPSPPNVSLASQVQADSLGDASSPRRLARTPRHHHRHVLAWGSDGYGQIGDGAEQAGAALVHPFPFEVAGLPQPVQLSAGDNDSLLLTEDGRVWIWGLNDHGQLGDGTHVDRTTPELMTSIHRVKFVAGGYFHNAVIKDDGTVWAWGENAAGELGQGTTGPDVLAPVRVLLPRKAVKLATGGGFTMALLEGGTVWGWGPNTSGQLGAASCPADPTQACGYVLSPVEIAEVSALGRVVDMAGQYEHTLFVLEDGSLYAMGQNGLGQLGIGSQDAPNGFLRHGPVRVTALSSKRVKKVAAGTGHSLALDSDGVVYGWGYNPDGQAGDGPGYVTQPEEITCHGQPCLRGATVIQAGHYDSEALVGGHVWAWGRADIGDLGQIVPCCSATPLEVPGVRGVTMLSSVSEHTLAYGRYTPDEDACDHPSDYLIADLAPLPGDVRATPHAMNDEGQTVGSSYGPDGTEHAVLWGYDDLPVALGALAGDQSSVALAINDSGQIVGRSSPSPVADNDPGARPVRFAGGTVTALPTLSGATASYIAAVNDSGMAVGTASLPEGGAHAVEYPTLGAAIDLGAALSATNINDHGRIVGTQWVTDAQGSFSQHAVAIVPGSAPTLLGPNPAGYPLCFPYGLNERGEAAGYCSVSDATSNYLAVLFQSGVTTALPPLAGDVYDVAWDLNGRGEAVGYSFSTAHGSRAVLFDGGETIVLATRVSGLGSWLLAEASVINDNGQIVGQGYPQCTSEACSPHGFLLTPSCDGQ